MTNAEICRKDTVVINRGYPEWTGLVCTVIEVRRGRYVMVENAAGERQTFLRESVTKVES